MQYPKALDVHKITSGQLYWCDKDTANTPYKAGLTGYTQGIALCTAGSAEEKWCSIIYIVHAGNGVWLQHRNQDGWRDWVQLAKCETPDIHELPLASDFPEQPYSNSYYKTQEGIVHLNFCITRGSSTAFTASEVVCTLPIGYRPSSVRMFSVGGDSGYFSTVAAPVQVYVTSDGELKFISCAQKVTWIYGEITYLAG